MLDTFIIDAIRREEAQRELEKENRIWLEIPEVPRRPAERDVEPEMGDPIVIPLYREDDTEEDAA